MEYLTIPELAKASNIPDSTCRRYIETFKSFFKPKYFGRVIKYPSDSVAVLKTIYLYYQDGKEREEIKELLREKHNEIIEINYELNQADILNMIIDRQENNIAQLKEDIANVIPQLVDRLVKERLTEILPQIIEDSLEKKVVPVLEYVQEQQKQNKKGFFARLLSPDKKKGS
jgi:hypothetical protein